MAPSGETVVAADQALVAAAVEVEAGAVPLRRPQPPPPPGEHGSGRGLRGGDEVEDALKQLIGKVG